MRYFLIPLFVIGLMFSGVLSAFGANNASGVGDLDTTLESVVDAVEMVLERASDQDAHIRGLDGRHDLLASSIEATRGTARFSQVLTGKLIYFVQEFFARVRLGINLALGGFRNFFYPPAPGSGVTQPSYTDTGVIVFPSSGSASIDKEVLAQLKGTFSDEIVIIPDEGGDAGVIKPVFRRRGDTEGSEYLGEDYLYLLVPLSEDD